MLISTRANTILLVAILAVGIAVVAMLATGARGGPLDPPAAPAATDGVREPGTPIASLPFTITQPGYYYLTRNLTSVSGINAISIQSDDTTLDLHGFTLQGPGGAGDGVFVSGAHTNLVIQNGGVRGWFNGIDAGLGTSSRISHVAAIGNGFSLNDGSFGIIVGDNSTIADCVVNNNKSTGIRGAAVIIRNCIVVDNGADGVFAGGGGSVLQGNMLRRNGPVGSWFDVRIVGDNYLSDNYLGRLITDVTTVSTSSAIVRNTYCGAFGVGTNTDASTRPTGATSPEFNVRYPDC